MAQVGGLHKWLQLKQYQLELTYSVYMFTPWEKFTFCASPPLPIPPPSPRGFP